MSNTIEIYVRPAPDGPIINIYVPETHRERFFSGLAEQGRFSSDELPINFEMTVLQGWTEEHLGRDVGQHVRVAARRINVHFSD